jgi:ABC-type nitrate/sulfonate/bicarbonate transport system permease component
MKRLVVPALLLLLVEGAAAAGVVDTRFVPTPSVVARGFLAIMSSEELWRNLPLTLFRVLVGFGVASALGVTSGLVMGHVQSLRSYLMPTVEFLRAIPGVALLPLTILWFGLGSGSQIPIIAFAAFFPILLQSMHGAEVVPRPLLDAGRVMELAPTRLFLNVLVPSSLPQVFTGLRLSIVYALTSAIGAEIIAGTDGLGFLILSYQRTLRTQAMFATMILVAFIGFVLSGLLGFVEGRALAYRRG